MTWVPRENEAGIQAIATTSTVQNHKIGKIVRAADPTFGGGEFIYLLGVVGTVVGLGVVYDGTTGHTALLSTSGVVDGGSHRYRHVGQRGESVGLVSDRW